MARKVDENEWLLIRVYLDRHRGNVSKVAKLMSRSVSTVARAQASDTFEKYKDLVFKERNPRKPGTLREDIDKLNDRMGALEKHLGFERDGCER